MSDHPLTDEAILASGGQWSFPLRDLCRQLERELASKDAHADEIYKAAVALAAKLEDDLAACREWSSKLADVADELRADLTNERVLADRLARELEGCAELTSAHEALAAWKEARK